MYPATRYVPRGYRRVSWMNISHPIYVRKGLKARDRAVSMRWNACTVAGIRIISIHSRWEKEIMDRTVEQVNAQLTGRDVACGDWNVGLAALNKAGLQMQPHARILSDGHRHLRLRKTQRPLSHCTGSLVSCLMTIDQHTLDALTAQAKASPRLRMNLDLRNSPEDQSQRMLNAIEPGTVMPVHPHRSSSETVVCVRGHFEEYLYDESGTQVETVDMLPGGNVLNVPAGQWHSLRSLASGTVLLECKDGKWEPLGEGDVME